MKSIVLKASLRKDLGKKAAKAIRTSESVPCVLYGGSENVNFQADEKSFKDIIYTPVVYVVEIDIDGVIRKAVIKEMQFHPVSDKLLHVDFQEVLEDKPITVSIPLKTTGSSVGVREGGKLYVEKRKLAVKGLVKDIPEVIMIDVTSLGVGRSIKAGDIQIDNVEVMIPKGTPVVSVLATRATAGAADTSDAAPAPAAK